MIPFIVTEAGARVLPILIVVPVISGRLKLPGVPTELTVTVVAAVIALSAEFQVIALALIVAAPVEAISPPAKSSVPLTVNGFASRISSVPLFKARSSATVTPPVKDLLPEPDIIRFLYRSVLFIV
jgi:hypothetical protein